MSTLYIKNLPADAQEGTLRDLLAGYGVVESMTLVRSGVSLRGVSQCVLKMSDRAAATAARRLNGQYFRGMLLQVEHRLTERGPATGQVPTGAFRFDTASSEGR